MRSLIKDVFNKTCSAFIRGDTTLANVTTVQCSFHTILHDTANMADLTKETITAPVTGLYAVRVAAISPAGFTGGQRRLMPRINGAAQTYCQVIFDGGDGYVGGSGTGTFLLPLNAGDVVTMEAYQSSGASLDIVSILSVTLVKV